MAKIPKAQTPSSEQEVHFEEWKRACDRLKGLSGYIQNDFDLLRQDGMTVEDLIATRGEFRENYDKLSLELHSQMMSIITFFNKTLRRIKNDG